MPASARHARRDRIFYGIPDVSAGPNRYAGRRVLVVGSGHSAFNVLLDLAALAGEEPGTRIVWAIRRPSVEGLFGGGEKDQLEERGRLGARMRDLASRGVLTIVRGFSISCLEASAGGIVVTSESQGLEPVDKIY